MAQPVGIIPSRLNIITMPGSRLVTWCAMMPPHKLPEYNRANAIGTATTSSNGARSIKFVCLLTCPEGVEAMHQAHPEVPIYAAALDRELDEQGYIVPGVGDAGDRIFGTK